MGRPKILTRIDYGQFLMSSQTNYTQTYFGAHHPRVGHDALNQWMRKRARFTSAHLWEHAKTQVIPTQKGYVLFDDTVLDKNFSHKIQMVRLQYSGNARGLIRGIGVVTCVYVNPELNRFWVIDYRIYAPEFDQKTKLDHAREMFDAVLDRKQLPFRSVLMDTWYATASWMRHIDRRGKYFYCPVKSNRLIRIDGQESYRHAKDISLNKKEKDHGIECTLHGLGKDVKMKMFQVVRHTTQNETIVTNDVAQSSAEVTLEVLSHR